MTRIGLMVAILVGCGDTVHTENTRTLDTSGQIDETGPVITHDPIAESQLYAEGVVIHALVEDELSPVLAVEVHYKRETSTVWQVASLVGQDEEGNHSGEIPASDVSSSGMHYYLYAIDTEGNDSFEPSDGASDPFHFRISGI